jgi:putative transposase
MNFEHDKGYHVYNRGNTKQKIFFTRDNYLFFLSKVRKEWLPYTDILAYCLMPNHFHFLIVPKENGCQIVESISNKTSIQFLSKAIGKTLSSYTRAINNELQKTGNLFQRKTKAKLLVSDTPFYESFDYLTICTNYIHFNPVKADLVNIESEWEFSSFRDYAGLRGGTLCNKRLLYKLSGMSEIDFKRVKSLSAKEIECLY